MYCVVGKFGGKEGHHSKATNRGYSRNTMEFLCMLNYLQMNKKFFKSKICICMHAYRYNVILRIFTETCLIREYR